MNDRATWITSQLEALNLHPGDEAYDQARQAAEAGWPAKRIRSLLTPPNATDEERTQ
jgi:hypothetical protein